MNRKTVLLLIAAGIALVGYLFYSSLALRQHRVEVCIEFGGRRTCRIALAQTEAQAIRQATQNACALMAGGVTDTIACENTPPSSIRRLE